MVILYPLPWHGVGVHLNTCLCVCLVVLAYPCPGACAVHVLVCIISYLRVHCRCWTGDNEGDFDGISEGGVAYVFLLYPNGTAKDAVAIAPAVSNLRNSFTALSQGWTGALLWITLHRCCDSLLSAVCSRCHLQSTHLCVR